MYICMHVIPTFINYNYKVPYLELIYKNLMILLLILYGLSLSHIHVQLSLTSLLWTPLSQGSSKK